jgi:hypothetical protein
VYKWLWRLKWLLAVMLRSHDQQRALGGEMGIVIGEERG